MWPHLQSRMWDLLLLHASRPRFLPSVMFFENRCWPIALVKIRESLPFDSERKLLTVLVSFPLL
jgi:hypothetical protein